MIDLDAQFSQQEARRRAMLGAMQIESWLPRHSLPFAAASNPALLAFVEQPVALPEPPQPTAKSANSSASSTPQTVPQASDAASQNVVNNLLSQLAPTKPSGLTDSLVAEPKPVLPVAEPQPVEAATEQEVPHFNLQVMRAENCLLLIDLRIAEGYQQSDPDYRLLRDLIRAGGIQQPPTLEHAGAPIQWPMLQRGQLASDQSATVARETVQYLLGLELQRQPAACIWLIGRLAMRFAADMEQADYYQTQAVEGLGQVWAIPSLELLIEQPQRKAEVWRSMQQHWHLWRATSCNS